MARTDWQYITNWQSSQHGTMRCNACGKPIEGAYRVRDGRNGFVLMHRACSASDPGWALVDRKEADRAAHYQGLLQAAIAFRDRWGVSDLDDLIESLSP